MRRSEVGKWLLYALGVLVVWIAETLFLNRLPLFGVIPVLLPLAAVAAGLWEGALPGAVFGLCLGIFADAIYPGLPGGMTLGLCIIGWLTGAMSQYRVRQNLPGYLICAVAAMVGLEVVRVVTALLSHLGGAEAIFSLAGRELACSLLYAIPIYFLFKLVHHFVSTPVRGVRL